MSRFGWLKAVFVRAVVVLGCMPFAMMCIVSAGRSLADVCPHGQYERGGVCAIGPDDPNILGPAPSAGGPPPVVGGTFEPDYLYPWVVRAIKTACRGVLIDPQWVLTAAHCVPPPGTGFLYDRTDPYTGAMSTESLNSSRYAGPTNNRGVFIHPMYAPPDPANDIALVKLEEAFSASPYVQTVALPATPRNEGVVGAVASGSHQLPAPGQLAVLRAPIPTAEGQLTFTVFSPMIGTGFCVGDSGSGFVTLENGRATVRGIASEGSQLGDCAVPSDATAFVDVFAHRDWILQTMGKDDVSLAGTTRVSWAGSPARGTMEISCPVTATANGPGYRIGPLNVVGTQEGVVCSADQLRTVRCNLDSNQGEAYLTPRLESVAIRTTMADGTVDERVFPASSADVRIHDRLRPGAAVEEFVCQIGLRPFFELPAPPIAIDLGN